MDAVILDLAVPWLVVPHAYEALRPSGILVSFSPTIDQVVKTTEALRENGFVFIETIECMMRAMQVERGKTRPQTLMTGHTGYITHARKILKLPHKQPSCSKQFRKQPLKEEEKHETAKSQKKLPMINLVSLTLNAFNCGWLRHAKTSKRLFQLFASCQADSRILRFSRSRE